MKAWGLLLFFIVVLVVLGAVCLLLPERIQAAATKALNRGPAFGMEPVKIFVASRGYLWNVRAVGALAIAGAAFLIWAMIKSG